MADLADRSVFAFSHARMTLLLLVQIPPIPKGIVPCSCPPAVPPVVPRFRALAGHCVRVLRLDALLHVVHHLDQLPSAAPGFVCAEEDIKEVAECVSALAR